MKERSDSGKNRDFVRYRAGMMMNWVERRGTLAQSGRMKREQERREPAYQKIQRALQELIEREKLRPGDTVPSERELAREHGVSLMTARSALAGLQRQGVVERRRGSGTFVAVPKIEYNRLISTTELLASRGFQVHSRVLCSEIVADEPEIAAKLGLAGNSPLVKLERLRQVDSEPLAIETSYLAAARYGDIATKPLVRGSLFATLEERFDTELSYSDEEVDATEADGHTAERLRVTEGSAVLRIRQLVHSTIGQPALYVLGLYRSDRHKLLIRRLRRSE